MTIYKQKIKGDIEPLIFNLPILFNKLKFKNSLLDIYISCLFIKNNISTKKIQKWCSKKYNYTFSEKIINRGLKFLKNKFFLRKDSYGYQIEKQIENIIYLMDYYKIKTGYRNIPNFYDSQLLLYKKYTFKRFRQSKFRTFRHYIFSELIARLYWNTPVTKYQLRNDLGLSLRDCNEISVSFEGQKRKHYTKYNKLIDNTHTKNDMIICTGILYFKHKFATKSKVNKHIKNRLFFNDTNYFYDRKRNLNYEEKMNFLKKTQRRFLQNKRSRQIYFGINHVEFSSTWRKNYLFPHLSELSFRNNGYQFAYTAFKIPKNKTLCK